MGLNITISSKFGIDPDGIPTFTSIPSGWFTAYDQYDVPFYYCSVRCSEQGMVKFFVNK